ncbi:UNVERIFIED_CONTAM: hypothetical protein FKN15_014227 [Acipenser sinensis]
MDAIELALSCSSLYKLSSKQGKDVDLCCSSNSSHILNLLQSSTLSHQELFQMNESGNHHMENDGYSDKSDCGANESSRRLTEESDTDQSQTQKDVLVELQATSYVEQGREEMAEAGVACQTETVSEENKGLMWTMLKQLRPGMDLSRVVLPTFILEPRSFLDKLSDYYYHADFLSQDLFCSPDPSKMETRSSLCGLSSYEETILQGIFVSPRRFGLKKPYNPILGETFRCCWLHPETDSCTFYVAEQVSHHPPVSAFYVCNKKDGFCVSGSILAKSKFYGNSLSAILDGKAMLFFLKRDEEYIITMPYAHCRGILYGTMTMELGGKVTIECEKTKYTAELEFKLKPFLCISSSVNMISGRILLGDELQATIDGHWDGEVFLCEKKSGDRNVFWSPTPEVRRQRLKRQVVHIGDQGEFESERLWLHVTNAIISKDQHKATQEKFILEEAQRQAARDQGDREWTPRLFRKDPISQDWLYKYADTNPWDPQMNLVEFEKDGVIQTLGTDGRRHNGISYSKKWATKQKTDCKWRKTSQNTESSSSTPEPSHESSDNESRNTGIAVKQRGRPVQTPVPPPGDQGPATVDLVDADRAALARRPCSDIWVSRVSGAGDQATDLCLAVQRPGSYCNWFPPCTQQHMGRLLRVTWLLHFQFKPVEIPFLLALKRAKLRPLALERARLLPLALERARLLPLALERARLLPLALERARLLPLALERARLLPLALERAGLLPLALEMVLAPSLLASGNGHPSSSSSFGQYLAKRLGLDTIWFGYLQTTVGIIQLLGGPVFGRFADLHGARAALTLSSLSSAVYFVILGCATNVPLLFISKLPAVFMHGMPGVQMVVTDLTEPGNRASALGRLGLCFGVGMIMGSSLGGSLSTRYG